MYVLPEKGISPSKTVHNCDKVAVADWILASSLFGEEDVSRVDVLDALMESQVYSDQKFCQEFVADIWRLLEGFFQDVNSPCLEYHSRAIRSRASWKDDKALSYCITASLRHYYEAWSKQCGNFIVQGQILEELTRLSLSAHHPNIVFKTTGWSGINNNQKFSELVKQICTDANFMEQGLELWDTGMVKDKGLDVYGYFQSKGRRPSAPFLMFQCASGGNWKDKRATPDIHIWKSIIQTYSMPLRGMAIPFLVNEVDFQQSLIIIQGPLLDRPVLLSGINGNGALGQDLQNSIEEWVESRIDKLEVL
ncbi:hypothetical protein GIB19_10805 [Pseudomonas sp. ITEM 17296]|uniref:hypothetical protein n=1 Tax=Pseudomonas sp. ITEM 17296 TaxID=2790281 RepID=UPI0023800DBC|nr:hypothetical protein [Pseudomonas sp. ITEM 17296]MDE4537704.1 hypothetical protein [Pseudomonas sp. ITEM 17296]